MGAEYTSPRNPLARPISALLACREERPEPGDPAGGSEIRAGRRGSPPLRIITIITRLIRGGAQRVALETAARLCASGHEAPLWCGPQTGAEGSLHEEAAARGVPVRVFPHLLREIAPRHDLAALRDLDRALRAERPDWIHTHSSKAGILGREAARRAGVRQVAHTVHGWGFTPSTPSWQRALFVRLERRMARGAILVFVNPGDLEEGRRLRILGSSRTRLIPPGIDLAPYGVDAELAQRRREARSRLGLGEQEPVAGFLGRLAPQKDPETLLETAAHVARQRPDVRWVIAGDGPLAPRLRAAAGEDPALRDRIVWTGLVQDARGWLPAFDLLVLPSRWEGAPLTVMEAMAAGVPVIASDLPGVAWLLQGAPDEPVPSFRGAGRLCPPGDAVRFAEAVIDLLDDGAARAELAREGREIARARFGVETMMRRLEEIYRRPAGDHP